MNAIDPVQLQRLIDGELDYEQTRRLVKLAESNPESWRLIASSFIENQVWEAEFTDEGCQGNSTAKKYRAANLNTGFSFANWISLAAMILLAFSFGFLFSYQLAPGGWGPAALVNGQGNSSTGQSNRLDTLVSHDSNGQQLVSTPAHYQVKVEDATGNSIVDSQVPLYSVRAGQAEEWLRKVEQMQRKSYQQSGSGFPLQRNIRYLNGQFEDGRQFILPVRRSTYSPGQ